MAPPDLPFHQWLRQLRKSCDLTQEMFAQQAGCAVSTIRKLEHGALRPSRDLALHLAQALKLAPDEVEQFARLAREAAGQAARLPQRSSSWRLSAEDRPLITLPHPITPFIGREDELDYIVRLFADPGVRLLALTGPGGVGKTRLAIRVGEQLSCSAHQGGLSVIFVALAALNDPKLVLNAIFQALRISEGGGQSVLQRLIDWLGARRVVLILDNFEHVLDAVHDIAALLHACPDLRILVTSRSTPGMYGEHVFPVAPLPLPDQTSRYDLVTLAQNAACALFIQRARAANPAFTLTAATAPALVEICWRLDGLPLALELAAARTRLLSADALLARMSHRLDFLTLGARTVDKRHQTLRDAIDWSYHLLDERRQSLFKRLALFAGTCDVPAVAAICYHEPVSESVALDDLDVLVRNSLVQQTSDYTSEARFYLLEVLHEYAWERLMADERAEELQQKHATYYCQFVEQAAPELVGMEQVMWLNRLERDHDNLRAALHWACTHGMAKTALTLAVSLGRFWWLRGYLSEGQRWLKLALALGDITLVLQRAEALYWVGILAIHQDNYLDAQAALSDSLGLYQSAQDSQGLALALNALGFVANRKGDHALAQARYEESLHIAREIGNTERVATSLNNLGYTLFLQGQLQSGRGYLRESLALARNLHDTQGQAFALTNLGLITLAQGKPRRAEIFLRVSLHLFSSLGNIRNSAEVLEGLAEVALAEGNPRKAAQLLGTAAVYRATIGAPLAASARAHLEYVTTMAHERLGHSAFNEAWATGQLQARQS